MLLGIVAVAATEREATAHAFTQLSWARAALLGGGVAAYCAGNLLFRQWLGLGRVVTLGGTYGALTITTDGVDQLWERALAEGAQVHSPLQDTFWGERHGQILDPFGHRWGLAQHLEDVPQDEVVRRAAGMFGASES